jgi:hypothetical protein
METPINEFLTTLTKSRKAILIGGLAVIAHGLSRGTKDADIWLEPMASAEDWLQAIQDAICKYPAPLTIHGLPGWQELQGSELVSNINDVGMIRVNGLPVPLDIFREPNGYEISQFESVWKNARVHTAGVRLPRAADLISTKEFTGRERDSGDWFFLLNKSRQEQGDALAKAGTAEEASSILADYFDYEICKRGLKNPHPEVRNIILEELQILATDGDPFAKEILEKIT